MAQTPVCSRCSTPLPENGMELGRVECPNCGETNFVSTDLNASGPGFAELGEFLLKPDGPPAGLANPEAPAPVEDFHFATEQLGGMRSPSFQNSPPEAHPQEIILDASGGAAGTVVMPTSVLPKEGPETFADIENFGNSTIPMTNTGGLVYHVWLEGIDTIEMKQELQEALSDRRLALEPKALVRAVRVGRLGIRNLNPVKASVLLNRIKHLAIQVRWEAEQLIKS